MAYMGIFNGNRVLPGHGYLDIELHAVAFNVLAKLPSSISKILIQLPSQVARYFLQNGCY